MQTEHRGFESDPNDCAIPGKTCSISSMDIVTPMVSPSGWELVFVVVVIITTLTRPTIFNFKVEDVTVVRVLYNLWIFQTLEWNLRFGYVCFRCMPHNCLQYECRVAIDGIRSCPDLIRNVCHEILIAWSHRSVKFNRPNCHCADEICQLTAALHSEWGSPLFPTPWYNFTGVQQLGLKVSFNI